MAPASWSEEAGRDEPHPALRAVAQGARRAETPCGTGSLVWRAWGAGRPLVLLHGGSGSWRHWCRNIPILARHHLVLCPDLPGLGDSDLPPAPGSPESIAVLLRDGLRDLLPDGRHYDLAGFSFGALCAGHLASVDQDRCRSLTIIGAGALGFVRSPTQLVKVRHLEGTAREEANRHNLAALMFADPTRIDEVAMAAQDLHTRRARFKSRGWANSDSLKQALLQTRAPLAGIYGELDAIARPHVQLRLDLLRSINADAPAILIPGAGHWVAYEAAGPFNDALCEILSREAAEAW